MYKRRLRRPLARSRNASNTASNGPLSGRVAPARHSPAGSAVREALRRSAWCWLGAVRAFTGGAIPASLAGEIYPDAYEEAGPYITLATAVGFLGPFLL
jgi:hypothetical protein